MLAAAVIRPRFEPPNQSDNGIRPHLVHLRTS